MVPVVVAVFVIGTWLLLLLLFGAVVFVLSDGAFAPLELGLVELSFEVDAEPEPESDAVAVVLLVAVELESEDSAFDLDPSIIITDTLNKAMSGACRIKF